MKREYGAEVETGAPQVAYREAISRKAEFNHTHKKQTGGSGQYGTRGGLCRTDGGGRFRIRRRGLRRLDPQGVHQLGSERLQVDDGERPPDRVPGHRISRRRQRWSGTRRRLLGQCISGSGARRIPLGLFFGETADSGADHEGFGGRTARIPGRLRANHHAAPGIIIGTTEEEGFVRVDTEVPLAEMFGYSTDLRSSSQGKAEYTMEFSRYAPVPAEVHQELVKKYGTGLIAEDEE